MAWGGTAPNQVYTRTDGTRFGAAVNVTAKANGLNDTAALADARENDFATAINLLWKRDGGNQPSANLPMNTYHFTGMGQGTARTSSIRLDQVQDGDLIYATVDGTANAIELTTTPVCSAVQGMSLVFVPESDSTSAVTVDLNGDGTVALQYNAAALVNGELQAGLPARITFDGTVWQLENAYLLTRLASTATGLGAALIGIEDAGGLITATTVEGALAENRAAIDAAESAIATNAADIDTNTAAIAANAAAIAANAADIDTNTAAIAAIEADYLDSTDIGSTVQAYDADTAKTDVAQEFTAQQNFDAQSLTDGTNIAWNLNTQQYAKVTLGGNRTLSAPSNMKDGGWYTLRITQDGTGSRTLSYNSAYKFPGAEVPTLSTGAGDVDVLVCTSDGTSMFCAIRQDLS